VSVALVETLVTVVKRAKLAFYPVEVWAMAVNSSQPSVWEALFLAKRDHLEASEDVLSEWQSPVKVVAAREVLVEAA